MSGKNKRVKERESVREKSASKNEKTNPNRQSQRKLEKFSMMRFDSATFRPLALISLGLLRGGFFALEAGETQKRTKKNLKIASFILKNGKICDIKQFKLLHGQ